MIGTLFGSFKNGMRPINLRLVILLVSCFMIASAGIAGTMYAVNTAPKGGLSINYEFLSYKNECQ